MDKFYKISLSPETIVLHLPIKYIIYLFSDVCAQAQKFPINPVQGGL